MVNASQETRLARTDRRKVRTRSALIGAGQHLFATRSFDGVTIDDIVEAADVAKGSFYNHFKGKENLAETIVELVQGDCEREVQTVNSGLVDPALRIARAVMALIRYARLHSDRYHAMVNLSERRRDMGAPINFGLRRDVMTGLEAGLFTSVTVEGGMLAVFGMISTAIDHVATVRENERVDATARDMAFMLLRALGVSSSKAETLSAAALEDLPPSPVDEAARQRVHSLG